MSDKMRELEQYIRLQVKESQRLATISASRHDSVDAEKWMAVSEAYEDCYTRLFGKYERDDDK